MKQKYRQKSLRNGSPISSDIDHVGREILASLYESLLADGHIDSKGKTEDQIMAEVRKIAMDWVKDSPVMIAIDFREDLLKKARLLKRTQDHNDAVLYYATWFEHWINGILLRRLPTLNERERAQMIRDVNLRGKFTWLLLLTHRKRLPQQHLNTIFRVCDLRNEFVHYKYKMHDADDDKDKVRYSEAHHAAEKTVRYLQQFQVGLFFKGSARGLLRKLRHTRRER